MAINLAPVPAARFAITHKTTGAGREALHREVFLEMTVPGGELVQRGDVPLLTVAVGEPAENPASEIALLADEVHDLVWWLMGQCAAPMTITESLAERMRDGEAAIRVLEAAAAFDKVRLAKPVADQDEHRKAREMAAERLKAAQDYWLLRRLRHNGPEAPASDTAAEAPIRHTHTGWDGALHEGQMRECPMCRDRAQTGAAAGEPGP